MKEVDMPTGPRILLDNALYHIVARGNQKQRIFHDDEDFFEYLRRIKRYKKMYKFKVYAYCLMP
ncbi:MAG: hypothetical protein NC933_02915, partial [Candidatus Omnitrophica bacterium]|nr:hypothetical protein [Candidatus Omnitrophota bacterium]